MPAFDSTKDPEIDAMYPEPILSLSRKDYDTKLLLSAAQKQYSTAQLAHEVQQQAKIEKQNQKRKRKANTGRTIPMGGRAFLNGGEIKHIIHESNQRTETELRSQLERLEKLKKSQLAKIESLETRIMKAKLPESKQQNHTGQERERQNQRKSKTISEGRRPKVFKLATQLANEHICETAKLPEMIHKIELKQTELKNFVSSQSPETEQTDQAVFPGSESDPTPDDLGISDNSEDTE
ncbi:unnamed protein product [Tuber aestivum]|uniref:Uncharacterized protein n=1 Tax=Tuber aestivum TaxID=59557 RepID=A0A292PV65_9PEZI|nr:unnamed protein product [Tuber aestivum]